MELIREISSIIIFCILVNLSSIYAQDVCVKKDSCKCVFSNGSGIDLWPSAKNLLQSSFFQVVNNSKGYVLSTYYYYPCTDIQIPIIVVDNPSNNTCNKPLAICRQLRNLTQSTAATTYVVVLNSLDYMGSSNNTIFSKDGRMITYENQPSQTRVQLVCAETDKDRLHIVAVDEPGDVDLAFYSRNACLKQLEEAGRSTGSTLCVIFFSVVLLYLVLGICTKKFLMGATGVEVIPNLSFWSDLPNLVKEGWAFAMSGFRLPARGVPAASPDPNSYDSI